MGSLSLERILYVEDDATIRKIVCIALESVGGFTVESCSSGAEAIARAPGFGPDLLLLDVMMPGMDGEETLRALRQVPETADTPVVFMTAKNESLDRARYERLGALDVVFKPFDPMRLPRDLEQIWGVVA